MNVVITGASKGIGKAIALRFLQEGHNIAICSRSIESLNAFHKEAKKIQPNAQIITSVCDISISSDIEKFATECISSFGSIDVLVNNGGIFMPGKITEEENGILEKTIETNLYSAYRITRLLIPHMGSSKKSHIFNICSIASIKAYPNGGSYSISKFAMLGFSKVLREELKPKGIKVTALIPGATWTDSWSGVDLPHDRLMDVEDIANTVWAAYNLGPSAVVEEIIIRPALGDL